MAWFWLAVALLVFLLVLNLAARRKLAVIDREYEQQYKAAKAERARVLRALRAKRETLDQAWTRYQNEVTVALSAFYASPLDPHALSTLEAAFARAAAAYNTAIAAIRADRTDQPAPRIST